MVENNKWNGQEENSTRILTWELFIIVNNLQRFNLRFWLSRLSHCILISNCRNDKIFSIKSYVKAIEKKVMCTIFKFLLYTNIQVAFTLQFKED